jgi:hypothetical protein
MEIAGLRQLVDDFFCGPNPSASWLHGAFRLRQTGLSSRYLLKACIIDADISRRGQCHEDFNGYS